MENVTDLHKQNSDHLFSLQKASEQSLIEVKREETNDSSTPFIPSSIGATLSQLGTLGHPAFMDSFNKPGMFASPMKEVQPSAITPFFGPGSQLHSPALPQLGTGAISKFPGPLSTVEPKLENIVSTVDLGCTLNLTQIALHAKNTEYNPKRFAALIMRIRNPKTTALIFASGKMVCTGAKSEADSETAARKYAKTIKKLQYDVKFKNFTIQNIVGSCSVNFRVNLDNMLLDNNKFCSYDPEIFPGLIFRMVEPRVVLLVFSSGKVILTGAKQKQELVRAFRRIKPVLELNKAKTGIEQ